MNALAPFVEAGVLAPLEMHFATAMLRLAQAPAPLSLPLGLGAALAARAPRRGHVCVELSRAATMVMPSRYLSLSCFMAASLVVPEVTTRVLPPRSR